MEFQNGLSLLDAGQTDHYRRCQTFLSKHRFYIDQSVMGSGKTYVALALAQTRRLALCIVGPKSAVGMWKEKAAEFRVPIYACMSYEMLTGVGKDKQPKHGMLVKTTHTDPQGNEVTEYAPSPAWEATVGSRPLFVIIDEAHHCKNPGNRANAVNALLEPLRTGAGTAHGSCFALLSASLLDKERMCIQFLRILGLYTTQRALVDALHGTRQGYEETVERIKALAPGITPHIAFQKGVIVTSAAALHENLYRLFTDAVLPACSSTMPDPPLDVTVANVFYPIASPVLKKRLADSYRDLLAAVRYDEKHGTVRMNSDSIAAVTLACMNHEWALAEVALRDAWAWRQTHPTGKVIVFTNYTRTLQFINTHLEASGWNTVTYDGSLSTAQRQKAIHAFQSNPDVRAFVANTVCGGVSISLHDLVGDQPRLVLIFPTYKILDVYQATGRAVRRGMRTQTTVRMLYSADYPMMHVFNALARKTNVLRKINTAASCAAVSQGSSGEGVTALRKYPGDFPKTYVTLDDSISQGGEQSIQWHAIQANRPFQDLFRSTEPV